MPRLPVPTAQQCAHAPGLLRGYIAQQNLILAVTDVLTMVLAIRVIGLAMRAFLRRREVVEPATQES
ncbi:MAG TPA: hypothetical protein PLS53_04570 [Thermoanaerobaculaceae bacterium]|nr:hypothetical protein [Thermoanaerobaculaceae bacterium]